jgi:hypothetical protein
MLSTKADVTETMLPTLAGFVCAAYSPKGIYIQDHLQTAMVSLLQKYDRK